MSKEIIVFSCGDSSSASTWSNVPYLFTGTLIKKGYKLHRVNIEPSRIANKIFNTVSYYLFVKLLRRRACLVYARTSIHRFFTWRKIKKATSRYPNIDFNLFLSYAFYNKYSDKPSVLWCDWTDEIVISRLGRNPLKSERASLRHEHKVIKNADLVISMFPECAEQMSEMYGREVAYLGKNIVNSLYAGSKTIGEIIETRAKSNRLLFIGNIRYLGGAQLLVESFRIVKREYPDLELHIIGLKANDFAELPADVHCYGYLRKDNAVENELYYELLLSAKVLVNPTPGWGAYSSTIEAMWFGCPVIVSPYADFVREFGESITFGVYNKEFDKLRLSEDIRSVIGRENYPEVCLSAHAIVKDYTWDKYVDRFLEFTCGRLSLTPPSE